MFELFCSIECLDRELARPGTEISHAKRERVFFIRERGKPWGSEGRGKTIRMLPRKGRTWWNF